MVSAPETSSDEVDTSQVLFLGDEATEGHGGEVREFLAATDEDSSRPERFRPSPEDAPEFLVLAGSKSSSEQDLRIGFGKERRDLAAYEPEESLDPSEQFWREVGADSEECQEEYSCEDRVHTHQGETSQHRNIFRHTGSNIGYRFGRGIDREAGTAFEAMSEHGGSSGEQGDDHFEGGLGRSERVNRQ